MVHPRTISIFAALFSAGGVAGNVFLAAHSRSEHTTMTRASVEQALALELSDLTSPKAREMMEELKPLFVAMPKNQHGKLEPSVVRYALHRYFAHKHGWHLKGLEAAGQAWNGSSPMTITKDQAPHLIQDLFEQRVHGEGLDLHELSAFAATMSDLVRAEITSDLQHIYETNLGNQSLNEPLSNNRFVEQVLEVFLVAFVNGFHSELHEYHQDKEEVEGTFEGWRDLMMWAIDLHNAFGFLQQNRINPFVYSLRHARGFEENLEFMEELVHKFGDFQKSTCSNLKEQLMELEENGSGRVRLSKFWSGAKSDTWPFRESVAYLRDLGALDETNPSMPTVLIPNYLHGKSNCMDPSDFYDVCCHDECESIMAEVERSIAGPVGSPDRLAEIVSGLPSDTVEAPRSLSTAQLKRLEDIASHHNGQVPLHGRLFAQWMHHAYPRECPFPHMSGTTAPQTPDDWIEAKNKDTVEASMEDIEEHLAMISNSHPIELTDVIQWSMDEELVAHHHHVFAEGVIGGSVRPLVFLCALASAAFSMWRKTSHKGFATFSGIKEEKHLV